jgi:hypothetical protein
VETGGWTKDELALKLGKHSQREERLAHRSGCTVYKHMLADVSRRRFDDCLLKCPRAGLQIVLGWWRLLNIR